MSALNTKITMLRTPRVAPFGFAMLEVLISVLVLSFGLLGLAGLQAYGLKNNHSAYLRSIATQQAYDIADRMRANQQGVASGEFTLASGIPTDPGCITSGCSASDMADYDMFQWNTDNAALLPSGAGVVCKDSTPNDVATPAAPACDGDGKLFAIKLWWNDERDPANLTRFVTTVQP